MSEMASHDRLEHLLSHLEQELLGAADSDLLADDASRQAGAVAREVVANALADRARRAARRGPSAMPRSPLDRRATVRQLLVASPRARDLVGRIRVDGLSDSEVEAILARFTAAGLLPRTDKE